jgi:carboxyl-terminal processing protease
MKFLTRFKPLMLVSLCLLLLSSNSLIYAGKNHQMDQSTRLSALAKVWGLLKYYHPELASGEIDWDASLITAIPRVKAAADYDSFNMEIDALIQAAGDVSNDFNAGIPAHPNEALFKWLKDKDIFSFEVRKKLQTLQKKHIPTSNYYVYKDQWNMDIYFDNEKSYNENAFPDENIRILGMFRFWNIIQYFSPYKEDMDQDWEEVLEKYIPQIIAADDQWEYALAMREFTNNLNDGHAVFNGPAFRSLLGHYFAPFQATYVDGKTIVTGVFKDLLNAPNDVQVGDIILKSRGGNIDDLRNKWRKYTHGSNEASIDRNLNLTVLRGDSNQLAFTFKRGDQCVDATVPGYSVTEYIGARDAEDAKLDKWKILDNNIGYIHMGVIEVGDVPQAMSQLMNTRAIIFDIRNYPNGTLYSFAAYLMPQPREFVKFTGANLDFPGQIEHLFTFPNAINDNPDYYKGRVIILVNESTQSQAEFTTMCFQVAPDVTVIGSQTAGADGNIAKIDLPANHFCYFSSLGIYYPDGTPTQ